MCVCLCVWLRACLLACLCMDVVRCETVCLLDRSCVCVLVGDVFVCLCLVYTCVRWYVWLCVCWFMYVLGCYVVCALGYVVVCVWLSDCACS